MWRSFLLITALFKLPNLSRCTVQPKWRVLASDGIDLVGKKMLEQAGFEVFCKALSPSDLQLSLPEFDALIVRSATRVTADLLKNGGKLSLIARAGVGLDNIDVKAAAEKKISVINTPNANSRSVAEMVFSHIFAVSRSLHLSNRVMPSTADTSFASIKAAYGKDGFEIYGKKLGVIGTGRIGREVAGLGISLGMEVLIYDYKSRNAEIFLNSPIYPQIKNIKITLASQPLSTILSASDIVTVHTPGITEVIGESELALMKRGAVLINCARGGVVNEKALISALSTGHLKAAGVDVFEEEPPRRDSDRNSMLLMQQQRCSLSPHIGAATKEAQERVGIELATRIIEFFEKRK